MGFICVVVKLILLCCLKMNQKYAELFKALFFLIVCILYTPWYAFDT